MQKLYVLDKAGFPQFTICWSSWCSTQPSFSVTPFSQLTSSLLFYHAQSSTFLFHYSCFSLWHQFRLTSPPPSPSFFFFLISFFLYGSPRSPDCHRCCFYADISNFRVPSPPCAVSGTTTPLLKASAAFSYLSVPGYNG